MSIKLVLADGHPLILLGLQQVFNGEADITVQARCADIDTAYEAVRDHRPDILVMDTHTVKGDPLKLLRSLHAESPATRVIILTAEVRDNEILEEMGLGVRGIVLKSMSTQLVVQCVRKVATGDIWLENQSVRRVLENALQEQSSIQQMTSDGLTSRQAEIVRMVATGRSNKAIAQELNLSEGTVKVHLHRIYQKLSLTGRMELMVYAQAKRGKSG